MNELILHMYLVGGESGRLSINFVPQMYRQRVKELLDIE